jgi:hypothetical protein
MKTIVLGTLGDLVRKICELSVSDMEARRENAVSAVAYDKIYQQWPISDRQKVDLLMRRAQYFLIQLKAKEASFAENNFNVGKFDVSHYFEFKYKLIECFKEIEKYSLPIGNPPLEIEVADEPLANVSRA